MKLLLSIILLLLSHSLFSQTIVVVDLNTKQPVEDVKIYTQQNKLIAISNRKGLFSAKGFPLVLKHWKYDYQKLVSIVDTVFLKLKYQQIEEVRVTPFDYQKFYDKLVKKSSRAILKDTSTIVTGVYFQSILEIDVKTKDSVLLLKECDVTLLQEKTKRKIEYSIYPSNGKASYRLFGEGKINMTRISNVPAFIPVFSKMLHYDLSESKTFKLKMEDFDINREIGEVNSLILNRTRESFLKTKSKVQYRVNYVDDNIVLWSADVDLLSPVDSITKKFGVAIKDLDMTFEFQLNENKYSIKSIVFKRTIVMKNYDGSLKEYHIVRAFIANDSTKINSTNKVSKLESYLENIEATEDPQLIEPYQF